MWARYAFFDIATARPNMYKPYTPTTNNTRACTLCENMHLREDAQMHNYATMPSFTRQNG